MAWTDTAGSFVFIAVPRTGCSSIILGLALRQWPGSRLRHAPLSRVPRRKGIMSFGFVRNPWDRMVSLYSHLSPPMSFRAWLLAEHTWLDYRDAPCIQRRTQSWYVHGCDRVGRFERLQADFDAISSDVGIPPHRLERLNGSAHRAYRTFYNSKTRAAVADWFAEDIEAFGYDF